MRNKASWKAEILLLVSALWVCSVDAEDASLPVIRLSTNIAPPYQFEEGDTLKGIAVDRMDCILSRMGWRSKMHVVPWKRAQRDVETGQSDAYFSATHSDALDQHATLSDPLILEKWYWYATDKALLKWDTEAKSKRLVGVILGANTENWVERQGFQYYRTFQDVRQLVGSLLLGRLEMFLADQRTLKEVLAEWPESERAKIHSRFSRYTPLGVYWSHKFLEAHHGFLKKFNREVVTCAPEQQHLEPKELNHILEAVLPFLERRLNLQQLAQTLTESPSPALAPAKILALDGQWRNEREKDTKPLISGVEGSALSTQLKEYQAGLDGVIEEVFVMDANGLIVGMSKLTSDYWQGDEAKFQETYGRSNRDAYVGAIEFDDSTRAFQVQVSRTLFDPSGKTPVGAITFGIDVEKALSFEP